MCRLCWLGAGQHLHQLFLGRVGVFFIESSMGLRDISQCPEKDLTTAFSLHQLVLSQLRIYQDTSAGAVKFREVPLTPLGSPLRSALVHCIINIRIGEAVRPGPAAARGHWVEVASSQQPCTWRWRWWSPGLDTCHRWQHSDNSGQPGHYPPLWRRCKLGGIKATILWRCKVLRHVMSRRLVQSASFHVNIDNGWQDCNLCMGAALPSWLQGTAPRLVHVN